MNDWIRSLKKSIEQIRNNNRTNNSAAGANSQAVSATTAIGPAFAGGEVPGSNPSSPRQQKSPLSFKDKQLAKKRDGGKADEDDGAPAQGGRKKKEGEANKENVGEHRFTDTSLRRRRANPSSQSMDEGSLGPENQKQKNKKALESDQSLESGSSAHNSLGRKQKNKSTGFAKFRGGIDTDGLTFGSLGRQSAANKNSGKGSGGDSGDSGSSGMERRKRKADEDMETDLPSTANTGPQLESVTKHRVKGPSGRRMPQSRRNLMMKHRASSLSALAHNSEQNNQDNPANRSDEDQLNSGFTSKHSSYGFEEISLTSQTSDGFGSNIINKLESLREDSECIQNESLDEVTEGTSNNGESLNSILSSSKIVNKDDGSLHALDNNNKVDNNNSTKSVDNNNITNDVKWQPNSIGEDSDNVDCLICNVCAVCRDCDCLTNEKKELSIHNKLDNELVTKEKSEDVNKECDVIIDTDCDAKEFTVDKPVNDKCDDKLNDNEEIVDYECNEENNKTIGDKLDKQCEDDQTEFTKGDKSDEASSKETENNKSNSDKDNNNKTCIKCSSILGDQVDKRKGDLDSSVSFRKKKSVNQIADKNTTTIIQQIETIEIDTFDDIDDALFFKPSIVLYDDLHNHEDEANQLDRKRNKSKSKKKKSVKLNVKSSRDSTSLSENGGMRARFSKFRDTMVSFKRVRLRTNSGLADEHPDDASQETKAAYCVIL